LVTTAPADAARAINCTAARANIAKTMERGCNDYSPMIITRKSEEPVVMFSLEDYQAIKDGSLPYYALLQTRDI
jgi:PHD/YefM family antitoxin component YafN of YafNO toxin-antitoxin module